MATLPSEKDFDNPETGPLLQKYLKGREGVRGRGSCARPAADREHDAGPQRGRVFDRIDARRRESQAQRIQIARQMNLEEKKKLAESLAGIVPNTKPEKEQ